MDMNSYTALAGIWMALATGSTENAPLPPELVENRPFEWAYVPMYSVLRPLVPTQQLYDN